jgi:hypothetical protein
MAEKQGKSEEKGQLTVEEAGRMGGQKGGQRERELVEKGHQVEEEQGGGTTSSGGNRGKQS